ncbi:MAG: hypothetical protein ACKO9I_16400, partial [Sphaerospermopsis kisseleviana]
YTMVLRNNGAEIYDDETTMVTANKPPVLTAPVIGTVVTNTRPGRSSNGSTDRHVSGSGNRQYNF